MIYPSIQDLSDKGVNRYALSIATAKCARYITDEQLAKAKLAGAKADDKYSVGFTAKKTPVNEKPVKEAIERLYSRNFKVIPPEKVAK